MKDVSQHEERLPKYFLNSATYATAHFKLLSPHLFELLAMLHCIVLYHGHLTREPWGPLNGPMGCIYFVQGAKATHNRGVVPNNVVPWFGTYLLRYGLLGIYTGLGKNVGTTQ